MLGRRQVVGRATWMALTAAITVVCAATFVAIRWLAALGVVHAYAVAHVTGTLERSSYSYNRALGLASGPSAALTNLDHRCGQVAIIAGVLWMARLALRASAYSGIWSITASALQAGTAVGGVALACYLTINWWRNGAATREVATWTRRRAPSPIEVRS